MNNLGTEQNMKKLDSLDGGDLKNANLAKPLKEYEGKSDREIEVIRRARIEADPILGPIYKNARTGKR